MDIYIYNTRIYYIDNTICATCATCKHPVVHESIHESIYFSVPEAVLLMSRKSETSKVSTRLSPTLVKTNLEPAKYGMDWILENTLTSFCPPQSAMPYHQAATLNNLKPSQARLFRCFSTSSRVGFSMCGMCNGGPMASFTCTRLGSKGRTGKPQGNTAGIESPFSHQRNFQAP